MAMTRYTYPHSIENGGGERLVFLRRVPSPDGDVLEGENFVQPGAGPPMHVHKLQSESLTVLQGRIGYQRPGEPERFGGPGETVTFKPGEGHRFWNAGTEELHCLGRIAPADNAEYFLTQLFESTKRNGGTRPDPFDIAFLISRYRSEFGVLEIPAAVQRVMFPMLLLIGRMLGKYRRYADAPEPVTAPAARGS